MPGMTVVRHAAPVVSAEEVCPDCRGTLRTVDQGGLTGTPGALVPCGCVSTPDANCAECAQRPAGACSCWVGCWPFHDGHTGWVPLTLEEFVEDGPCYRPCPAHRAAQVTAAAPLAVIA